MQITMKKHTITTFKAEVQTTTKTRAKVDDKSSTTAYQYTHTRTNAQPLKKCCHTYTSVALVGGLVHLQEAKPKGSE